MIKKLMMIDILVHVVNMHASYDGQCCRSCGRRLLLHRMQTASATHCIRIVLLLSAARPTVLTLASHLIMTAVNTVNATK